MTQSIKMILSTIIAFMMFGCGISNSPCPPFPEPKKETLKKLQDLSDKDLDSWMVELFKLKLKLKVCNE